MVKIKKSLYFFILYQWKHQIAASTIKIDCKQPNPIETAGCKADDQMEVDLFNSLFIEQQYNDFCLTGANTAEENNNFLSDYNDFCANDRYYTQLTNVDNFKRSKDELNNRSELKRKSIDSDNKMVKKTKEEFSTDNIILDLGNEFPNKCIEKTGYNTHLNNNVGMEQENYAKTTTLVNMNDISTGVYKCNNSIDTRPNSKTNQHETIVNQFNSFLDENFSINDYQTVMSKNHCNISIGEQDVTTLLPSHNSSNSEQEIRMNNLHNFNAIYNCNNTKNQHEPVASSFQDNAYKDLRDPSIIEQYPNVVHSHDYTSINMRNSNNLPSDVYIIPYQIDRSSINGNIPLSSNIKLPFSTKPCYQKVHQSAEKSPYEALQLFLCYVFYHRFNISYYFSFYFNRIANKEKIHCKEDTTKILDKITNMCFHFAVSCTDEKTKLENVKIKDFNYKQLKICEDKLLSIKKINCEELKYDELNASIAKIREGNILVSVIIQRMLKYTTYKQFIAETKTLYGKNFFTEKFSDIFLFLLKPLIDLSVLFDKFKHNELYKILENSSHKYSKICSFRPNTQHCLFNWCIFWLFSFSNYDLVSIFNTRGFKFFDLKYLPVDFFVQSAILIFSFYHYDNMSVINHYNTSGFIEKWKININDSFLAPADSFSNVLIKIAHCF